MSPATPFGTPASPNSEFIAYTEEEIRAWTNDWEGNLTLDEFVEQYRQANSASEDAEEAPHDSTASSSTTYHVRPTRTKIPGHNSLLFDPGSRINIIGSSTAKEFDLSLELDHPFWARLGPLLETIKAKDADSPI